MDDLIARMAGFVHDSRCHCTSICTCLRCKTLAEYDAHRATADGGKDAVWGYIRHRDIARLTKDADLGGWCPEIVATPDETFDTPLYAAPPVSGPAVAVWMPIETAPKDGMEVLLFRDGQHHIARYIRSEVMGPVWTTPDACVVFRATHWMPLPSPPPSAMSENPVDLKPR